MFIEQFFRCLVRLKKRIAEGRIARLGPSRRRIRPLVNANSSRLLACVPYPRLRWNFFMAFTSENGSDLRGLQQQRAWRPLIARAHRMKSTWTRPPAEVTLAIAEMKI